MKLKIEKEIIFCKEKKTIGYKCDVCGKEFFGGHSADMKYREELYGVPDDWFTLEVWSNYDVDQPSERRDELHLCSPECYINGIKHIVREMNQKYHYLYHVSAIPMSIMREIANRL
jgi:hypothetical protein